MNALKHVKDFWQIYTFLFALLVSGVYWTAQMENAHKELHAELETVKSDITSLNTVVTQDRTTMQVEIRSIQSAQSDVRAQLAQIQADLSWLRARFEHE